MRSWLGLGLLAVVLWSSGPAGCGGGQAGDVDAGEDGDQAADGDGGGLCAVDGDCGGDARCVDGVCRPAGWCAADQDCPQGSLCNQLSHACVAAECLVDGDTALKPIS